MEEVELQEYFSLRARAEHNDIELPYSVLSHLGSQSNYIRLLLSEGRINAYNLLISKSFLSHLGSQSNFWAVVI